MKEEEVKVKQTVKFYNENFFFFLELLKLIKTLMSWSFFFPTTKIISISNLKDTATTKAHCDDWNAPFTNCFIAVLLQWYQLLS